MSATAAYLGRLGIEVPPPPTLDALFLLHRRHLERVPYENLAIMLGRPPSVDAVASLERIGAAARPDVEHVCIRGCNGTEVANAWCLDLTLPDMGQPSRRTTCVDLELERAFSTDGIPLEPPLPYDALVCVAAPEDD